MHALTVLHRWFGVAFCLVFAMWFASGLVMHWVAYPELTEDERVAGLSAFIPAAVPVVPVAALQEFKRNDVARLRLAAPAGRPVY
ncbi:MAG: PepSY domain-containing protein, partial [Burkholderiales bacterium]